jgi:chemosensory pili system protein ChpB (putative protein-glutamate methylesterase)
MSEPAPAVALLFDDTELVEQLRQALQERGARIVHEGGVASLSRDLLDRVGAEVLVVNLDDSADDALDQLYEVIDTDLPRVVFNDAQASRTLTGWDRARWARHLAVKVMAGGDLDPPRPDDARSIEIAPAVAVPPASNEADSRSSAEPAEHAGTVELLSSSHSQVTQVSPAQAAAIFDGLERELNAHAEAAALPHDDAASAESENLAAELEALLALGETPAEDDAGGGLRFANGDEPPPLHDGDFSLPAASPSDDRNVPALDDGHADVTEPLEVRPAPPSAPVFQLDHLQLTSMVDASTSPIATGAGGQTSAAAIAPLVRAPADWALLDDESLPDAQAGEAWEKPDAAAFGIQKLSAADFLAPDVEQAAPASEPVMSLQLMSMEEAVAPQAYQPVSEMVLNEAVTAVGRLVLLGAAVSGAASVAGFLAALPAATRLTFLLVQHAGGQSAQALVEQIAAGSVLPVRVADHGVRARTGEVLVVPAGQQVRVRRDGSVELHAEPADTAPSPSIDANFTLAANEFGPDALAIVFAGRATDGVAGAQAVHDRGGQVWVESSSGEHFADMVSGIFAERLVSFSGVPHELAAHLVEVLP